MRERFTSWVALALLAVLVVASWWAADYTRRAVPVDPERRITHEPDMFIDNFVMMRVDDQGRPNARLEGPRAVHFPDDDSYEVTQPRLVNQQEDGSLMVATAREGTLVEEGNRLKLHGDARVERPPHQDAAGLILTSDTIHVLRAEQQAWTDLPADVLRDDGSRLQGTGMRYDHATRELHIDADARVLLTPPQRRP